MDWERIATGASRWMLKQRGVATCFLFKDKEYVGLRTSMRREDVNTDAGLYGVYAFSLLVPVAQLDDVPEPRPDKVEVGGVTYRILGVETDATGCFMRLHLGGEMA